MWFYESGIVLNANETIGEYAQRRLMEEQESVVTARYDRRYVPNVLPGDLVRLHYPAQDLNDIYMVSSQTITLGHSARTSEEIIGAN